ncbi:ParA family protein [Phenylobacterium sp.]|uniref:ParA family protein n=1 Tax=Phenylobacterium sp. TaxID=1871053 RepID=UPI002E2FE3B6|nr:ParA family protein [Phenylobacterium sp.]HEX2558647.1 ParA family protein [Phenylobacterium sp.]
MAFVSPKGGAGKTTASMLLALGLSEQGHRVAMIDADPNKPLVHWASLPGRPNTISVHAAPFEMDLPDALREANGKRPDWIILDTEGSARVGLSFTAVKPDLVITPLASSALEALQALKMAEIVGNAEKKLRRPILHACLLTRLPAAVRPKSLKGIVEQLRLNNIAILPTGIIEKEAFRMIFALGGDLASLERNGVYGVGQARTIAHTYVNAVKEFMGLTPPKPEVEAEAAPAAPPHPQAIEGRIG